MLFRVVVLLVLCLVIAAMVAVAVRSRAQSHLSGGVLKQLADRAIDLALSHREIPDDAALASLVLKRATTVNDSLPSDLLLLAEQHMETSPGLAWAIADAARDARKQLP
ncbi:MAG: hypothetical protein EOO74_08155 [Myxococcales bacterium]|nr:MAG: hypothetical protein EOO74_08155 [Myxococcales bacterium]